MEYFFNSQNITISSNNTLENVIEYLVTSEIHPTTKYYTSDYPNISHVYDVFCEDEAGVSISLYSLRSDQETLT